MLGKLSWLKRSVCPDISGNQVLQRGLARFEQCCGQAHRQDCAEGIPIAGCILRGNKTGISGHPDFDDSPRFAQFA